MHNSTNAATNFEPQGAKGCMLSTTILFFQISSLENARNYKGTVGNDQNINIKPDCNMGGLVRCHFSKMISFCMQLNAI